ncbi:MAG: hypothetical protein AAGI49_01055 [Bacteroidota bacterium]
MGLIDPTYLNANCRKVPSLFRQDFEVGVYRDKRLLGEFPLNCIYRKA